MKLSETEIGKRYRITELNEAYTVLTKKGLIISILSNDNGKIKYQPDNYDDYIIIEKRRFRID